MSQTEKNCLSCKYNDIRQGFEEPCKSCMDSYSWYKKWESKNMATVKPTVKEIEEYMAGLNGITKEDIYNVVSKPKHYMLFDEATVIFFADNEKGIEVRDVIEQLIYKIRAKPAMVGLFESDYVQLMQYLMRFMDKNGKEDLEKARWYLDKMISAY